MQRAENQPFPDCDCLLCSGRCELVLGRLGKTRSTFQGASTRRSTSFRSTLKQLTIGCARLPIAARYRSAVHSPFSFRRHIRVLKIVAHHSVRACVANYKPAPERRCNVKQSRKNSLKFFCRDKSVGGKINEHYKNQAFDVTHASARASECDLHLTRAKRFERK